MVVVLMFGCKASLLAFSRQNCAGLTHLETANLPLLINQEMHRDDLRLFDGEIAAQSRDQIKLRLARHVGYQDISFHADADRLAEQVVFAAETCQISGIEQSCVWLFGEDDLFHRGLEWR